MEVCRNVIIRFDSFKRKPKAGYTIILEGMINHHGSSSKICIEISGSCMINDISSRIDEEVLFHLETDFKNILGEINPSNIRKIVNQAKKECISFQYKVCVNTETDVTSVSRI